VRSKAAKQSQPNLAMKLKTKMSDVAAEAKSTTRAVTKSSNAYERAGANVDLD